VRYQDKPARQDGAINLAAVTDFTLGSLRVQPSRRRVSAGAREELVEPRVMQALVALAQAGDAVVSRDALIDRCWGGRIVGDDAINRCIAKVRRLAETAQPAAFSIETVSKVGYRLRVARAAEQAPVAIGPLPKQKVEPAPVLLRLPRWQARRWGLPAVLGLLAFALAAQGVWHLRADPQWTVQSSHPLLPRLEGETGPAVSPNGSMLAYAAHARGGHWRIYAKNLQGGTPLAVSSPDGDAESPAWASDSLHLAYVAIDPKGGPCRIMVTTFPGGTPSVAGRCPHARTAELAWQPATPYLFLGDKGPTSYFDTIFRVNVETGDWEPVTSPTTSDSDFSARISPDGAWLAYIRERGFAGNAVRLRRLAGGKERELDCSPGVTSIDWTTDSRGLIASVPGQMGGELLACPANGARAYRIYASDVGLGRVATGPDGMLAVQVDDWHDDLARAHPAQGASADLIEPAAGMTGWPAFAPDGTLAFVCNRSGSVALWTRKPGGEPVELVRAGLHGIERPVWSPDGSRIAFCEATEHKLTIHVVTAQGEKLVAFSVPSVGYGMPNWTPDGEHLVMFDKRILQAVRVDLRDPSRREPVEEKLRDGVTYYRGGTYSTSGVKPGIWELDGGPRLITPDYPVARRPRLAFLGDDVLLPGSMDGGELRILAQPLKGGAPHVAFYAPAAEPGTPLAVDPRTGDVVYVTESIGNSHITLLTIARQ